MGPFEEIYPGPGIDYRLGANTGLLHHRNGVGHIVELMQPVGVAVGCEQHTGSNRGGDQVC